MAEEVTGFVSLEDIDWTRGDENADTIYLQWNCGWGSWEQVIDEAKDRRGVVAFVRQTALTTARAEAEGLRSLLSEARESVNDASAAVPNDEWRHAMQGLVERIDAALTEPRHD